MHMFQLAERQDNPRLLMSGKKKEDYFGCLTSAAMIARMMQMR